MDLRPRTKQIFKRFLEWGKLQRFSCKTFPASSLERKHLPMIKKNPFSFAPSIAWEIENSIPTIPRSPTIIDIRDEDEDSFFMRSNKFNSTKNFLRALKPFVFIGRIFGVFSRSDIFDKDEIKGKANFAFVLTSVLTLFTFVNAILMVRLNISQFSKDKTVPVKVEGFCNSGYACVTFLVYLYQLFATTRFRKIVLNIIKSNEWSRLGSHQGPDTKWFAQFPHGCAVLVAISMTLGILDSTLDDVQRLSGRNTGIPWNAGSMQMYYMVAYRHWYEVLPSWLAPITIVFVILIKFCTLGWIFTDTICKILCKAVSVKLHILENSLENDLAFAVKNSGGNFQEDFIITSKPSAKLTSAGSKRTSLAEKFISRNLDDYHDEYILISDLVNEVGSYISPMVIGNIACNMYIVVVLMFQWIGPMAKNIQFGQSLYIWFALFHFGYRIFMTAWYAANVHQISVSIKRKLQAVPNEEYSISVERLERNLQCSPAGICLFGAFMITRTYLVSIIGVLVTSEVMLLLIYAGYSPSYQS